MCTTQPSAFVTLPICSLTSTCCSIVMPVPPSSVRHVHREQPQVLRELCVLRLLLRGISPLVLLGVLFPGDQVIVDEPAGAFLDRAVLVGSG